MQCKNHPNCQAESICSSCGKPLCRACAIEGEQGKHFCLLCHMCYTVSGINALTKEGVDRISEKKVLERKQLGPFRYLIILSQVLVLIMLSVIFWGG